jgi:hypothetical protein
MARLPKCPLCGAKCEQDKHGRHAVFCVNPECLYWVGSPMLHIAICKSLRSRAKAGRVLARGHLNTAELKNSVAAVCLIIRAAGRVR